MSYNITLLICLFKQVLQIVKKTESLRKISFLAHSLGGLFARYAITILYTPDISTTDCSYDNPSSTNDNSKRECSSGGALIAKLKPINFITLATPHLGVRGKNQVRFHGYNLSSHFLFFSFWVKYTTVTWVCHQYWYVRSTILALLPGCCSIVMMIRRLISFWPLKRSYRRRLKKSWNFVLASLKIRPKLNRVQLLQISTIH